VIGDIYHICNRGIRKEKIFDDDSDYLRFVLNLYRLNNKGESLRMNSYRTSIESFPEQNKIVEIVKWTLLPNHYHLLLYEKIDGGVLEFVKRLGNAFTKYINIKREKSGYLFQNSARIIPITRNEQFLYIPFYIDLNLLDLIYHENRHNRIDIEKSLNFCKNYKWSSFRDYFGDQNSPFSKIINKDLFYECFDTDSKNYEKEFCQFLEEKASEFLLVNPPWRIDK
jgi:putative transposase